MKKLILVRHGETGFTEQNKYCGHCDAPLSGRGIRQARRLHEKLKKLKVDKVYSSDLLRTMQTAMLTFRNNYVIKNEGLREIDFGRLCGLTFEQAEKGYPDIYKTWMENPKSLKVPGGESVRGFAKRVLATFKDIAKDSAGKTVAIVSHGGPIRIILLKLKKMGLDKFWDIEVKTASVTMVGTDHIDG